ncbi:MAG: hypothetical protein ABUR63_01205 [Verrucomicrobiota bacterium]
MLGFTAMAGLASPQPARAQDVPPPAAGSSPPAVEVAAVPPAPPPVAPPPPATPPSAVEAAPKPPTAAEAMPASRPDVLPPIAVGAWTRIGGLFQNGSNPKKVDDFRLDNAYVELHVGGKIHKKVGVTLNLNSNLVNFGGASPTATPTPSALNQLGNAVQIMDAIIQFDLEDELHIWAGHLLVPVDRSNASGPFFMIPWNYPGFFTGPTGPVGAPKEGPSGRNNGLVVWGDIMAGKLTYLAGVFDNANIGSSPLFSGRLRLALLDPEPGFWGNGSYFGDKDLLSIGVGAQAQKHGSSSATEDKSWFDINADVLFEKKIPGGGWVTAEGAYYHFNVLDGGVSDSWYALLAYATPTIGVGNIQPMVRYQGLKVKANDGTNPWNLDAGLSYLIKGPDLRLLATYSHTKLTDELDANSIQIGAQAIFF